jgi:CP family cyanate transporter-like MFS transporter
MIFVSLQPWLAAAFIGIGAGTLFSLSLLSIDITKSSEEAASWSAMIQSVGYVIDTTGPFIIGLLHDTTNSFIIPIIGMISINCLMIIMQMFRCSQKKEPICMDWLLLLYDRFL